MRLEHVNLTVKNVDRSAAFYSDLLDFHVRWKGDLPSGAPAAHVGNDDTYLALFEARAEGESPGSYDIPGYNHMGFVVEDLDDAAGRLTKLGTEFRGIYEESDRRSLYFNDPDGHEVELVQY